MTTDNKRKKPFGYAYILLLAVITMTICTKASPIYPFDDYGDVNCFITVGRCILNGMVPYRDIVEQKGPILYFLHALAIMVPGKTFFGVYLLEIISCFFSLVLIKKIFDLNNVAAPIFWLTVFALIIYTCGAFYYGDTAEELCMPFFVYAVYLQERYFRNGETIRIKDFLIIGITSGCVFWIKFSLVGFYVGWFIIPAYIILKSSGIREFAKSLLSICLGVAIVTVPIVVYFAANKALGDLSEIYFFDNIVVYGAASVDYPIYKSIRNLLGGMHVFLVYAPVPLFAILLGTVKRFFNKVPEGFAYASMFCFTCLTVFIGGQGIQYYPMAAVHLSVVGIIAVSDFVEKRLLKGKPLPDIRWAPALLAIYAVLNFVLCSNTSLLAYKYEDMPQAKFAAIVCKEENPTLLNYGFLDGGFYTACDVLPSTKYFCELNAKIPEMLAEQNRIVDEGFVGFIVTRNETLDTDNYELVETARHYVEGSEKTFYLYKLKQNSARDT